MPIVDKLPKHKLGHTRCNTGRYKYGATCCWLTWTLHNTLTPCTSCTDVREPRPESPALLATCVVIGVLPTASKVAHTANHTYTGALLHPWSSHPPPRQQHCQVQALLDSHRMFVHVVSHLGLLSHPIYTHHSHHQVSHGRIIVTVRWLLVKVLCFRVLAHAQTCLNTDLRLAMLLGSARHRTMSCLLMPHE